MGGSRCRQAPMRRRMAALAGVMVLTRSSGGPPCSGCCPDSFCSRWAPTSAHHEARRKHQKDSLCAPALAAVPYYLGAAD